MRSITAPVEMLSSLITSSPSSVPLSVASSIATPDTGDIIDDMREETNERTLKFHRLELTEDLCLERSWSVAGVAWSATPRP